LGRAPRVDLAGGLYHGLNRENAKHPIFFKDEDYEAFVRIIVEGLEKFPVDLFSYQSMNNHWCFAPGTGNESLDPIHR
jgi:putative transposase